ncbi:MAG TPA: tetratricopeptide repeat protein [Pyrinomonadaceae bacterium]|jgi:Tfp pilus assembly protein PilF
MPWGRPDSTARPSLFAALAAALLLCNAPARAQVAGARAPVGGSGGEHEIYGEFKVDESRAKEKVPGSFVLVLMTNAGKVVERQSAQVNSSFRFFGLRNGEYQVVVESVGMAVARFPVLLNSSRKIESKLDITLEWVGGAAPKPGAVSAAEFYQRGAASGDLFEKASAALKKKKYEDAAALLRQVLAADEKDHIAWAALGSAYNSLGKSEDAESSYRRALELRPDLLAAAYNLGRLYAVAKDYDRAAEALKTAVEKHPGSADANFLLAEVYAQMRRYEDAAALYREALRLDPKGKADGHLRLAGYLDATGRKAEAAAELKQFLEKNPGHPNREKFEEYIRQNGKR